MSDAPATAAARTEMPACDVIFRGGITSGVVYPGTVAGLAAKYRLVSIGGASAGAIAAGVAAAAEYGRQSGRRPDAFAEVADLAEEVGGAKTSLRTLFRASPQLWLLDRLLWAGLRFGPWAALAAVAAPGVVLATLGLLLGLPLAWAVVVVLLGLVGSAAGVAWLVFRGLPAEGFGLCPGIHPGVAQTAEAMRGKGALMDWMHATIQRLAGRSVGQVPEDRAAPVAEEDRPLTMGDLWSAGGESEGRRIDLLLTTTNLSQQLPHQFPFLERAGAELLFDPEELARVLPRDVVRWMVRAARPVPERVAPAREGLLRLPAPADLPVLFGVRLSLSFPGLIAAVPLHAPDYARAFDRGLRWKQMAGVPTRACWFSDGGITSNFPIHMFDSPLPRRPTFCVNLREAGAEEEGATPPPVWMPRRNSEDIAPRFHGADAPSLAGFLGAIVDTARNGHENELMLMPGHRDRIVHVTTGKGEGGLNLDMGREVIGRLSARGAEAAGMLVDRFHPDGETARTGELMGWRNHRWIRLRSSLAGLERMLGDIAAAWHVPDAQASSYAETSAAWSPTHPDNGTGPDRPPGRRATPSYRWRSDKAADAAGHGVDAVLDLAATLQAAAKDLSPPGTPAAATSLFDVVPAADGQRAKGGAPLPKLGLRQRPVGEDPRAACTYR